jgi:hypothetical protein
VDIFSAGILYYELFVPQLNGRREKVNQLSRSIREGMQKFDRWEQEFDLDTVLDETNILDDWRGCLSVLKQMVKPKANERPSASEILVII